MAYTLGRSLTIKPLAVATAPNGVDTMPITKLRVAEVGPFDEITLEFDDQVNVFTGPNNSGKSTLLWVLGELLVYPLGIPAKVLRSDECQWNLNISSPTGVDTIGGTLPILPSKLVHTYEEIGYTCYVPAQRHGTNFRSSGPTLRQDIDKAVNEELEQLMQDQPDVFRELSLEEIRQDLRNHVVGEMHPELARRRKLILAGSSLVSDVAVKQKIVDLDYAAHRRGKPAIKTAIFQVASIVSEITEGFPIEFMGVAEDAGGLYPQFRTPDGDLPLDVLSQGTQSIIQFLARLLFGYAEYYDFPSDLEDKPGILIIDEVDAHLHPTWQRRVIPALTNNFPNLQIFCSTHSPLMLAGLMAGQVQLLRRDENGKVTVSANTTDIAGWTADEILHQFMDVPLPTDQETSKRLGDLEALTRKQDLSDAETEELKMLQQAVHEDLLKGPNYEQVKRFAEELKQIRREPNLNMPGNTGDRESSHK